MSSLFGFYICSASIFLARCPWRVFTWFIMAPSGMSFFSTWRLIFWWGVMPLTFRILFVIIPFVPTLISCSFLFMFKTVMILSLVSFIMIMSSFPSFVFFGRWVVIAVSSSLMFRFLFWFLFFFILLFLSFLPRLTLCSGSTDFSLLSASAVGICNSFLWLKLNCSYCNEYTSCYIFRVAGVVQWWKHLPTTDVVWIRFSDSVSLLWGLSLLLVLILAPRGFSPGTPD